MSLFCTTVLFDDLGLWSVLFLVLGIYTTDKQTHNNKKYYPELLLSCATLQLGSQQYLVAMELFEYIEQVLVTLTCVGGLWRGDEVFM